MGSYSQDMLLCSTSPSVLASSSTDGRVQWMLACQGSFPLYHWPSPPPIPHRHCIKLQSFTLPCQPYPMPCQGCVKPHSSTLNELNMPEASHNFKTTYSLFDMIKLVKIKSIFLEHLNFVCRQRVDFPASMMLCCQRFARILLSVSNVSTNHRADCIVLRSENTSPACRSCLCFAGEIGREMYPRP